MRAAELAELREEEPDDLGAVKLSSIDSDNALGGIVVRPVIMLVHPNSGRLEQVPTRQPEVS
jgi:hypothetical protein